MAVLAYYLGIFSLLPLIGFPLAVASIVLGAKALKYCQAHPEADGRAHAGFGIGASLFSCLYNVPIAIIFVVVIVVSVVMVLSGHPLD